jgi:hypothetical protein
MDEKREDDRIFQYEEPSEEDWHREQIEIHPERYR